MTDDLKTAARKAHNEVEEAKAPEEARRRANLARLERERHEVFVAHWGPVVQTLLDNAGLGDWVWDIEGDGEVRQYLEIPMYLEIPIRHDDVQLIARFTRDSTVGGVLLYRLRRYSNGCRYRTEDRAIKSLADLGAALDVEHQEYVIEDRLRFRV